MKLFSCGKYRQLNPILYPNNHYTEIVKIIFNGLVLKDF